MTEIKVRLSMEVPGATMLSTQECVENSKNTYNEEKITVVTKVKKGKVKRETIIINTRKCKPARQVINITEENYRYMVDPNQPPTDKLARKIVSVKGKGNSKKITESTVWAMMPVVKRLEWHLAKIAESLNAISYRFEVLDS